MSIAYLLNTYPVPSATFIRGEIEGLEKLGVKITRYAIRRWEGQLIDSLDLAEERRTQYIMSGNLVHLLIAAVKEVFANPVGLIRCFRPWLTLYSTSRRGFIRHVAYFLQAIYVRQCSKAQGIDHLHVHYATNAASVALLVHILGGPTYSFTSHGPDEFAEADELCIDLKVHHSAFVVAISRFCRDQLTSLSRPGDRSKIRIVRCGLALADFRRNSETFPENRTLVCVGRICPQKGQVHIPKAVAALRNEFPDLRVILIGDGESRAVVEEEIATHNVGDLIELRGWLSNFEVRKLIQGSRGLLLPSYAEGLPTVIMEAFALCRPVISTTVAGIPELVDQSCGWLIPPGSEDDLVRAIRAMLISAPSDLERKGMEGRRRVERWHDRRAQALRLEKMLNENTISADHQEKAIGGQLQC
jgi:glycosyltransferase involved in cell wall biosynthesis